MNTTLSNARRAIRRQIVLGAGIAAVLLGGVVTWSMVTSISGAVVAQGTVAVDSNVKKVQHATGGIVGEILVRDGDRVRAGDVLVRLDDTLARANLGIVAKALDEQTARRARLEAERDGLKTPAFPQELTDRQAEPAVANAITSERKLFDFRRAARLGQKEQLTRRVEQAQKEVAGLAAQEAAKVREIAFVARELEGARTLSAKGLIPISKLTMLERDAARLEGERGQVAAAIAQTRGRIAETELQIVQLDRDLGSEVAKELRDIDARRGEMVERRAAAEDQLRRIEVRAPQAGVVTQSAVHTVGGVVMAGDTLMLVVPDADRLVVEARIAPKDVDQVHAGQSVMLRFSAFNQKTTPEVRGTLDRVSADIGRDERTGESFYLSRVAIDADAMARLGEVKLVPGMPVEVFAETGERRVASYLVKPLADQMARAFRED